MRAGFVSLPVAARWFETRRVAPGLSLILEPHVHVLEQANIWLVDGRERDLLIDAGMGVAPLAPVVEGLRADPAKELVLLVTHTHLDHVGSAHEFAHRLVHPVEADRLARPAPATLMRDEMDPALIDVFRKAGYPELWPCLIDALPHAGYDPRAYRLEPAPATGLVSDGDVIDLGDRAFEVLHLPGHSPGQVGLWEAATGTLFGADAIYDGPLIWDGPGMSVADYAATLRRIAALPVEVVHGGHDPSFGRARMREIADSYLRLWEA